MCVGFRLMSRTQDRGAALTGAWSTIRAACRTPLLLAFLNLACMIPPTVAASEAVWDTMPDFWKAAHVVGDLPLMPSSEHGPNSTSWRNSVAICATMKHENSTDLREWLLYYQCVPRHHLAVHMNQLRCVGDELLQHYPLRGTSDRMGDLKQQFRIKSAK